MTTDSVYPFFDYDRLRKRQTSNITTDFEMQASIYRLRKLHITECRAPVCIPWPAPLSSSMTEEQRLQTKYPRESEPDARSRSPLYTVLDRKYHRRWLVARLSSVQSRTVYKSTTILRNSRVIYDTLFLWSSLSANILIGEHTIYWQTNSQNIDTAYRGPI